jgi:esterase/lipase
MIKMKTIILILISGLYLSAQDTTMVSYTKPVKGIITVTETKQFADRKVIEERQVKVSDIIKEMEKELQNVEMMQQEETFLMEQIEYLRERIIDNRRNMRTSQRKLLEMQKLRK